MASAIIVAAGSGLRMGAGPRKQYRALGGQPVVTRTLRVFDACAAVEEITLVVPGSDLEFCRRTILPPAATRRPVRLTAGGDRRQDSVFNGLQAAGEPADGIVLVHDGVRPLVPQELLQSCIQGARRHGACVPALPATDTLKRIDAGGRVIATLDRTDLRAVQTPQAFTFTLLLRAHEAARREGLAATDDAAMVEALGHPVQTIPGSPVNLKITTPGDLALARALDTVSTP